MTTTSEQRERRLAQRRADYAAKTPGRNPDCKCRRCGATVSKQKLYCDGCKGQREYTPEQRARRSEWERAHSPSPRNPNGKCADCGCEVTSRAVRCNGCAEKRNLARTRAFKFITEFGITPEDYDTIKDAQGGVCAICGSSKPKGRGDFHVDHCHDTNKVRGLLCMPCNVRLGWYEANSDAVALYLAR